MNYKLTKDKLILLLAGELSLCLKVLGPCRHAQGVCYCSARELVIKAREMVASKKKII